MATDWVKVGTDVGIGGAVGVVDQLVQNADTKRILEYTPTADKPELGIMRQFGTYYNYGVPILAVLATAMGWVRGDWATRAVVAGSQLAGRKVTKQVTKKAMTEAGAVPYGRWQRDAGAQHQAAAARAKAAAGGSRTPAGVGLEF